jgi:hypothetical protein
MLHALLEALIYIICAVVEGAVHLHWHWPRKAPDPLQRYSYDWRAEKNLQWLIERSREFEEARK